MKRHQLWMVVLVAVVLSFALKDALSADSGWWWSVGPVYRAEMDVEYSGSSYVQEQGVHAAASSSVDSGVGPADGYADRTYQDGFVNMDVATLNDALTWYWGYANPAQYNAAADTLSFHGGNGGSRVARTTTMNETVDVTDDTEGAGVRAEFGRKVYGKGQISLDVCGGVQGIWNLENSQSGSTYSETITSRRYTVDDVYALEGVIPLPAPYEGTYNGPGPLIPNIPTSRQQQGGGGSSVTAENDIHIDTEADLESLWLGARASWKGNGPLVIFLQPFVSFNYLDLSAKRTEQFNKVYADGSVKTLNEWKDDESESEWLLGAGVSVGGRVSLNKDWFVDLSMMYENVEEGDVDVGPNTVTMDPSGYSVSLQIGRGF